MDDAITTSTTGRQFEPPMYTELLPDWVHEELAAHRDKLPELRAAICEAICNSKGILAKGETNQEQKYKYAGFDAILDAVRLPMAQAGLTIDQVSCDLETELHYLNSYGKTVTIWKWRCIYLITHKSGAAVVRIVRPMTSPGNKASSIASSSADRMLITRLMRLAGGKDEAPGADHEDRDNRGWNTQGRPEGERWPQQNRPAQQPPQQQQTVPGTQPKGAAAPAPKPAVHREFTDEQRKEAAAIVDTIGAALQKTNHQARVISWSRVIRGTGPSLPRTELDRAWALLHKRCAELNIEANHVSAQTKAMESVPWAHLAYDEALGEMLDKRDGTLL